MMDEIYESLQKNESIARNHPITTEIIKCPHCKYLFSAMVGSRIDYPCPFCGTKGIRCLFPKPEILEYQEMISYFFVKMTDEIRRNKQELMNEVEKRIGRRFEEVKLETLSKQLRQLSYQKGDKDKIWDEMLKLIGDSLSLNSEDSKNIYAPLWNNIEETYEGKVIVIIFNCFIEFLKNTVYELYLKKEGFDDDVIYNYLTFNHTPNKEIKAKIDEVLEKINKIAGEEDYFKKFWCEAEQIKRKRNVFVHNTPYIDISLADVIMAFELTQQAPGVFVKLQNELIKKDLL